MNDFTKEELADLKDYINYAVSHSYGPTADKVDKIYNKIQSMIDNYCEHENIVTGAYPRSNPPKKCEACGVLHYDNQ